MKNKENFFSIVLFFLFFVSLSSTALVANAQSALPAGPYAYITNSGNNTTSVIDTATNTVTATINVQYFTNWIRKSSIPITISNI